MSAWQPYVTELMKNNNLDHGAVCGAGDGMIWASDPGFKLSTYEVEVHVDVDTKKKESVNEQAILLEGKLESNASLQDQGTGHFQGRSQNQRRQIYRYYLR